MSIDFAEMFKVFFTDEKPAEDAETVFDAEMKAMEKALIKELEKNGKIYKVKVGLFD